MGLPTLNEVKKIISEGFNKRYQETIKDSHIEAVYEVIEKLMNKNDE